MNWRFAALCSLHLLVVHRSLWLVSYLFLCIRALSLSKTTGIDIVCFRVFSSALSGLPQPQKAHALIMTKFADDCRCQMQSELHNLITRLGPKVLELALRIGLHSGPVTVSIVKHFDVSMKDSLILTHSLFWMPFQICRLVSCEVRTIARLKDWFGVVFIIIQY